MDENIPTSYDLLKDNIYNKMKKKLFIFPIKVEYNIISNFLLNPNILRTFFRKEMTNAFLFKTNPSNKKENNISNDNNQEECSKSYNDFILLNNNIKGSEKFKVKSIYNKHCLNHSILILRFIKAESSINTDINITPKINQILDSVISFYTDINDNSTVLINELYSNFPDSLLQKFIEIVHLFYIKLQKFVKEKMNKFVCFESILIPKKMTTVFNYLNSCKIFHNEKIKIEKIDNLKEKIEISGDIGSLFPVSICETKLFINRLSNNACLLVVLNWMKISDFNKQGKLLNIQSIISVFLKKLRCRIKNEEEGKKENEKEKEKNNK